MIVLPREIERGSFHKLAPRRNRRCGLHHWHGETGWINLRRFGILPAQKSRQGAADDCQSGFVGAR
jgi:hypothetical protein